MGKERYELINMDTQTVFVTGPMDEIDSAISNQEFRMLHKRDGGSLLQWFKESDRVLEPIKAEDM